MAALTGTPVVSAASGSIKLTITNNSDWDICYAYLTAPTQDTWGNDRLSGQPEIVPGASQIIPFDAGTFDLRAENCDYMALDERYGVGLSGDYTWQVNGPQELYFEDFSGGQSGWKITPSSDGQASLVDESLHLTDSQENNLALVTLAGQGKDSRMVVESTSVQKPTVGTAAFGVMCRVQANGDGYLFLARSDNQFSIEKVKGQLRTPLVDWSSSQDVTLETGVSSTT